MPHPERPNPDQRHMLEASAYPNRAEQAQAENYLLKATRMTAEFLNLDFREQAEQVEAIISAYDSNKKDSVKEDADSLTPHQELVVYLARRVAGLVDDAYLVATEKLFSFRYVITQFNAGMQRYESQEQPGFIKYDPIDGLLVNIIADTPDGQFYLGASSMRKGLSAYFLQSNGTSILLDKDNLSSAIQAVDEFVSSCPSKDKSTIKPKGF